jgi:hypothetical protein
MRECVGGQTVRDFPSLTIGDQHINLQIAAWPTAHVQSIKAAVAAHARGRGGGRGHLLAQKALLHPPARTHALTFNVMLSWREYVFSTLWPYVAEHPLYAPHAPGGGACASALPSREIAATTCTHTQERGSELSGSGREEKERECLAPRGLGAQPKERVSGKRLQHARALKRWQAQRQVRDWASTVHHARRASGYDG